MRTIVPFVLSPLVFSVFLSAQAPRPDPAEQIERLEKRVTEGHSTVPERVTLANLYLNQKNVEGRRRQILWLIENHPDVAELRNPQASLDRTAPLPDPIGFAQAAQLWREQAAKPAASPKAIANTAFFFRFEDRVAAKSLLDAGWKAHPGDPDIARMRGMLDAIVMSGVTILGPGSFAASAVLSQSPDAAKAREEVESSRDAKLLGGAAAFLSQQYFRVSQFNSALVFRDADVLTVAESWLLRAREIESDDQEWKNLLSRVYEQEAGEAADPGWKVQLYRKADALDPKWNGLPNLALAEVDAAEDEAATRDAHRLLDRTNAPPAFAQVGHTVLGRIALAKGDVAEAKAELFASVPALIPPGMNLEPNRTLAQDLVDRGERDAVVQFLEQCREFWKNDRGSIDHYIKMAKSPGSHDLLGFYQAGADLRGRPVPKLPIEDYSGKVVAVQFRNASCKTCQEQFAAMEKLAGKDVRTASIDAADQKTLTAQLEIETVPTWVLVGRDGRITDYLAGNVPEGQLRATVERLSGRSEGQNPLQKLPAPVQINVENSAEKPGMLAWSPVPGAESYVVQWDQRDEKGWISDRDDHLVRVIPAHETSVTLDPALGETAAGVIRWRVFAVNRFGPGSTSEWREMKFEKP